MASGGRPLHDEAVDAPPVSRERGREGRRRHDREKARPPPQPARRWLDDRRRIEAQRERVSGGRPGDVQRQRRGLVADEPVEEQRDVARNAGADQHVIHAREQRAVENGRGRQL